MTQPVSDTDIGHMVSEVVSAYVSNHLIKAADLPILIRNVRSAFLNLGSAPVKSEALPQPAVPIKKSVFYNYIICLEDGKKLKVLKRHLLIAYQMTPADYRRKWGLPDNYPMTAPAYAKQRSNLAKAHGLGQKLPREEAPELEIQPFSETNTDDPHQGAPPAHLLP